MKRSRAKQRPVSQIEREVHAALALAWKQTRLLREREAQAERGLGALMKIWLR